MRLSFETLRLIEKQRAIRFVFLRIFYFDIAKEVLGKLGSYAIEDHAINIDAKAEARFNRLLLSGFNHLVHMITKKPATYIHRNSGLPLVGNNSFGIVDRNTNIIEVKPITGCNLDCIYCSVPDCNRVRDYVVEEEYLIEELNRVIKHKECDDIEVHIGVHGEPFLYADMVKFVKDIRNIREVKRVSVDTNGMMLSESYIDELVKSGITKFNVSINTLDQKKARQIANASYNVSHVKKMVEYLSKNHPDKVHIAPVVMFGMNEEDMAELIKFAKKNHIRCYIQNFLEYSGGLKPVKQKQWEYFMNFLRDLEKKHKAKLLIDFKKDFQLKETKPLPKFFKKNDVINAQIVCEGRMKNEWVAAFRDRTISFTEKNRKLSIGKQVKLKIVSLKHNISVGVLLS